MSGAAESPKINGGGALSVLIKGHLKDNVTFLSVVNFSLVKGSPHLKNQIYWIEATDITSLVLFALWNSPLKKAYP